MKPFYLTTAIAYPNGRPHIGHAYEAIATDVVARFERWMGREVLFVTGTDEHGLKMLQAARAAGTSPRALADENSGLFRALDDLLGISYDRFVRTTEAEHHRASQELWRRMEAIGDIYRDRYEGWYSVRDEAFYDEGELVPATDGGPPRSPQGTPVEWTVEDSFFFRLSAYQDRLLALYEAQPGFVRPETRMNEVRSFVAGGLRDLAISRTSIDWGVPVPGAPGHVMYVWVDALTTYLTGTGWPGAAPAWPADLHVIGKDIVRFHAVYWPAFLMSAGLPLPGQVFGHGFLLARGGEKMSKSAGNAVDPVAMAETYGVDALRYFLLREVPFGQDGSYSHEAIVARVNADLANSFGNLAQRVLSLVAKNCVGEVPQSGDAPDDAVLLTQVRQACAVDLPAAFAERALHTGIEAWRQAVFACNAYVDQQAPWTLAKTDRARMAAVLGTLYAAIRLLAIAIAPVIPTAAARLLDAMGVDARDHAALADDRWFARLAATDFRLAPPTPIFPRLDPLREPA